MLGANHTKQVDDAEAWLSARPVGATLVEYMQRVPSDHAEALLTDVQEIKRLSTEEELSRARVKEISGNGWLFGLGGAAAISTLGSWLMPPAAVAGACGFVALTAWWYMRSSHRRESAMQSLAWSKCNALHSGIRERLGIQYTEADGRVRSLRSIQAQRQRITRDLALNEAACAEVRHGIRLGREAGIDTALVEKAFQYIGVIGGFQTDEIVELPGTDRFFREMCSKGLREHTLEAVLQRYGDALPISTRTKGIVASRIESDLGA